MGAITKPLTFAAGKRGKWLVLLFWIIAVVVVSPFASKLFKATNDAASSYLPGNAESTKALDLDKQFASGETIPAILVYYRESGLTPDDRAKVAADRDAIAALHLPDTFAPSPPVPSEDGKAILYAVPFAGSTWDGLADRVKAIRDRTGGGDGGLDIKVTGPAGYAVDFLGSFANLNTRLFLGTFGVVAVLLLITYRSPVLWLLPLISVGLADQITQGAVYGAAKAGLTVSSASAFTLIVLTFGVGTDYALLLVARYREELRRHEDRHEAMAIALRRVIPAITASAATVTISLLCLLVAALNSNKGLGPVCAIGIILTLVAMLTLLPALLVIFGRGIFWPFIPRYGSAPHEESGFWARVGGWISGRPRAVWVGTALALGLLTLGLFGAQTGIAQSDTFRTKPDSVRGQELLANSHPSGASQPATIYVQPATSAEAAQTAAKNVAGVAAVGEIERGGGDLARFPVTLNAAPGSQGAFDAIDALRGQVKAAAGPGTLVGGNDAVGLDTKRASTHDERFVIPLVLLVVLVILGILLRSVVAPLVLVATVILSFAAALGASSLVFDKLFGFAGQDASLPLQGFIFLVALGIDYNIFLMARVREEATRIGTRRGMVKGLAVTGGVITSAGLVLAGTFAVLTSMPLVTFVEEGFLVAFGVLLDTLIVRSILVPALTLDIGRRMWWPSRLRRPEGAAVIAEQDRELATR